MFSVIIDLVLDSFHKQFHFFPLLHHLKLHSMEPHTLSPLPFHFGNAIWSLPKDLNFEFFLRVLVMVSELLLLLWPLLLHRNYPCNTKPALHAFPCPGTLFRTMKFSRRFKCLFLRKFSNISSRPDPSYG
jgi:hypothetical protein